MMDKYYVSVKPKVYKSGIGLKLCHACKALQSKSLKKKRSSWNIYYFSAAMEQTCR